MSTTPLQDKADVDERLSALLTNAAAVRAVAGAVENTLGPKGLDTMLVDRNGGIVVTNAGVTILDRMEVSHPAARMVINIARTQHEQIGDGTTTATIMAGALVNEGLGYVIKGVPVSRLIEGMEQGIGQCLSMLEKLAVKISDVDDPNAYKVALVAGRGCHDIAAGVCELARLIGPEKVSDRTFRLSDRLIAEVGAPLEVYPGLIIKKRRINEQMPRKVENTRVLVLDDSLAPEELSEAALRTEAGFAQYLHYQELFRESLEKIVAMGIRCIVLEGGIDEYAEECLTREGVMVLSRLYSSDFRSVVDFTGARPMKRTGLGRREEAILAGCGFAGEVVEDVKLGHVRIAGGKGRNMATMCIGASTEEVVGEKERIASDAACSLQAALCGGIVPGGGSAEFSLISSMKELRRQVHGMTAYGIDCVIEALKRPMAQIITNAGFNPLEKLEDVARALEESGGDRGIDCDTGEVCPLLERGVIDPLLVKKHALQAAMEVASAILRINTIIKMKDGGHRTPQEGY